MVSGKAMGGTSKINGSMYTRSTPGEYNAWARDGRKGWSYDEVEPYFNRSEKSLSHGKSPHRGSNGKQHA
jgi:choline dehydrogenase-like flavoprotein